MSRNLTIFCAIALFLVSCTKDKTGVSNKFSQDQTTSVVEPKSGQIGFMAVQESAQQGTTKGFFEANGSKVVYNWESVNSTSDPSATHMAMSIVKPDQELVAFGSTYLSYVNQTLSNDASTAQLVSQNQFSGAIPSGSIAYFASPLEYASNAFTNVTSAADFEFSFSNVGAETLDAQNIKNNLLLLGSTTIPTTIAEGSTEIIDRLVNFNVIPSIVRYDYINNTHSEQTITNPSIRANNPIFATKLQIKNGVVTGKDYTSEVQCSGTYKIQAGETKSFYIVVYVVESQDDFTLTFSDNSGEALRVVENVRSRISDYQGGNLNFIGGNVYAFRVLKESQAVISPLEMATMTLAQYNSLGNSVAIEGDIPTSFEAIMKDGNVEYIDLTWATFESTQGYNIPQSLMEGNQSLKEIILTDQVEEIGKKAFMNCANLRKVSITSLHSAPTLTIEDSAFESCRKLEEVVNMERITTVSTRAFYHTVLLKEANLPRLQMLKDASFQGDNTQGVNNALSKVVIGGGDKATVKSIANEAFANHSNITELYIAPTVINLGRNAFGSSKINIPATVQNSHYDLLPSSTNTITLNWDKLPKLGVLENDIFTEMSSEELSKVNITLFHSSYLKTASKAKYIFVKNGTAYIYETYYPWNLYNYKELD